jgi:hypothetical protein
MESKVRFKHFIQKPFSFDRIIASRKIGIVANLTPGEFHSVTCSRKPPAFPPGVNSVILATNPKSIAYSHIGRSICANTVPVTLLDIFHATPQSSQRLIPIAFNNQCVASLVALRATKMSGSVRPDIEAHLAGSEETEVVFPDNFHHQSILG